MFHHPLRKPKARKIRDSAARRRPWRWPGGGKNCFMIAKFRASGKMAGKIDPGPKPRPGATFRSLMGTGGTTVPSFSPPARRRPVAVSSSLVSLSKYGKYCDEEPNYIYFLGFSLSLGAVRCFLSLADVSWPGAGGQAGPAPSHGVSPHRPSQKRTFGARAPSRPRGPTTLGFPAPGAGSPRGHPYDQPDDQPGRREAGPHLLPGL
jgi:hypothetical protein